MNDSDLCKAIETLNQEKAELLERYQFGISLQNLITFLKKGNFGKIYQRLREKCILKFLMSSKNEPRNDCIFETSTISTESRIAVYTCVVGDYDLVQPPMVDFENIDFYFFTDCVERYQGMKKFIIKKIPDDVLKMGNVLANRYVKFHPKEMLGEDYDFSIYMDGNIRVVSDVRQFVNCCSSKTGLAMHLHRTRQCIYEEAESCLLFGKGNRNCIKKQMKKYKKEGFPRKYGMNEANVIVADLNKDCSISLLDCWWKELIECGSGRDQLAWPYVLWTNGFSIENVGFLGKNIYKNFKIEIKRHD